MADGRGHASLPAIVQSHHAAVAQGQLDFALALLAGHLARHGTVHLVGQPVFASHGFEPQHAGHVFIQPGCIIRHILVSAFHSLVVHIRLGTVAEHLRHVQVERAHPVALLECEMRVAGRLAHDIHRGAFALGNLAHVVDVLLLDEQAHALLRLVGDDFLGRQRLVADGQLRHVNQSAAVLHQFGQAVHVSRRAVVVDGHHGVHVLLTQRTNQVVGTFLHLGIGTLHGIQLNAGRIAAGVHRRDGTSAQPDAIVIAAHDDHLVAFLRSALQAVALRAVAHAAGQHDDLVVAITLAVLLVLKRQHGTGNQRLPELVAEIGRAV